jgi:hypothetical protein
MAGLGQGILDEGAMRFFGFGNAKLALRNEFPAQRRENRVEFLEFLGVVRSEDEFHGSMPEGRFLLGNQLADAGVGQVEQLVHLGAREGLAFGGPLHLDDAPPAGHHDVHVGVAVGVFGVVEVEHRDA